MQSAAVVLLFKFPRHGKVKTRLATSIGAEHACKIAQCLLRDCLARFNSRNYDLIPFIDEACFIDAFKHDYACSQRCYSQIKGDLGQRMSHAAATILSGKYSKVIIIGSDSPHINPKCLELALDALTITDVALGPSLDGGYYLVGCHNKAVLPHLFTHISWSTSSVLSDTMTQLNKNKYNYTLLDKYNDIDTIDDLLSCYTSAGQFGFSNSATIKYINNANLFLPNLI